MDGDQIRIAINAAQTYEAWLNAEREFRHSYAGRMNWSKINGYQYLYRIIGNKRQSLGRRSPETEKILQDYQTARRRVRERCKRLRSNLDKQAKINKAYGLGRIPKTAAKILRALDAAGVLGSNVVVVGTHSLYAYEAAAGVTVDSAAMATSDIDLLLDARRRLRLATLDGELNSFLSIIRSVDRSFEKMAQTFRAANKDGYMVDLIRPMEADEMRSVEVVSGDDLEPVAIAGLEWLISAPRFERIAIASDGMPVRIVCTDPRAYALYKHWMSSSAQGRDAGKRRRDLEQARIAAVIAKDYLGLQFKRRDLAALPKYLADMADAL
ncbi:MAG: GSU2403 family nucleotidyltransferase fold protein [Pseudomonadota bacterium]